MAIDFHAPSNVGAYASRSAPAGGRSCVGPHLVGDTTPAPWVQADATSFRFREEEDGFAGWMTPRGGSPGGKLHACSFPHL